MPQCKRYNICGRNVEDDPVDSLYILHSTDPAKDALTFAKALATHREHKGDNFVDFVFPGRADFRGARFIQEAVFDNATFTRGADFNNATFTWGAVFSRTMFNHEVTFQEATFHQEAEFRGATFTGEVYFSGATFAQGAVFAGATFGEGATFTRATFSEGANFEGTTFIESAGFFGAIFLGRTLLTGHPPGSVQTGHPLIFVRAETDFRQVVIDPPDAVTFLGADLTKCKFLDTDLRKVQFVDIAWPRKGRRTIVYDEIALVKPAEGSTQPWSQVERLYRELKQNYEDRRDYERTGDFHYGEKEMRRQNPETPRGLRFFLTLYWLFSGYGERYLRPLLWAGLLFGLSTIGYMWWGLRLKDGSSSLAWTYPWINPWDWLRAAYYSFRVMTLLKPDDWVPLRYAQLVNTFQTLLGPVFLGLFALALRQRLKR
jgi:uncharacterized protein YjbI with pentapeptide repeats